MQKISSLSVGLQRFDAFSLLLILSIQMWIFLFPLKASNDFFFFPALLKMPTMELVINFTFGHGWITTILFPHLVFLMFSACLHCNS